MPYASAAVLLTFTLCGICVATDDDREVQPVMPQVTSLQLKGGGEESGYIEATLVYSNGTNKTGPVCGYVSVLTGIFACYSKGRFSIRSNGTVASIDGISCPTNSPAVASNMSCTNYYTNNGQITYECTFNDTAGCADVESVAVECSLTVAGIVLIVISILIFCLCFYGCCCCCGLALNGSKPKADYKAFTNESE